MADQIRAMDWNQNYLGELRDKLAELDFHLARATDTLIAMRETGQLTDNIEHAINHSREAIAALRVTINKPFDTPNLLFLRDQMDTLRSATDQINQIQ
jgi:hypothetical protein